jgi:hypothetical protein
MTTELEHEIRQRAHSIWEQEGRPSGRAEAHWALASAELTARPSAGKRASRPAAATAAAATVSKATAPKRRKAPAKLA